MHPTHTIRCLAAAAVLVTAAASARAQDPDVSEETIQFFQLNCASCHTVGGGKLTGPDLKGVAERRERAWIATFVLDPRAVIDGGDPVAQELFRGANGVYMPSVPGLTRDRVEKLIDLLVVESAKERSRFVGLQLSDRALTEADVARGRRLFEGSQPLAGGAPACLSCHTTGAVPGLGGGRLGPDLSDVYARLEGRKPLAAWLAAPPSPTMQPVFKERPLDGEEVLALVAYLADTSAAGGAATPRAGLGFLFAGIGGVLASLVGLDFVWRRRFRAVRRPLVRGTRA